MHDLGDPYPLSFTVTDAAGAPADAGNMAITITAPSDVTIVDPVASTTTGVYDYTFTPTEPGRHGVRAVATGANACVFTDSFDVDEAAPNGIVSLADARAKLNFTRTVNDEELRGYIDEATDYIEGLIGPVVRRTIVEKVTPASGLLFTAAPIISLTSMTDTYGYGWTFDVANFAPDGSTIAPLANVTPPCYPVTVTYVGGRTVIDPLIRGAALDYVKWAWESQRGPSGGEPGGQVDEFAPGVPATPPYKIAAKLARYMPAVVA